MTCAYAACLSAEGCVEAVPRGQDGQVLTQENGIPVWKDPIISPYVRLVTGHIIGTYTNETGNPIDVHETITRLTNVIQPGNRIGTYENEDGGSVDFYESITLLTNALASGHLIGTYTNEEGDPVDILETLTELANVIETGHIIGTYTNEEGETVTLRETITTVVNNADGTTTFTNEAGESVTFGESLTTVTGAQATGNVIGTYTNEAGDAVTLRETITTLVVNPDGSMAYTNEAGETVNVPAPAVGCPAILIDSSNDCANGGIGDTYAVRSADFDQAACALTINGAPEHYTVSEEAFNIGQAFDPPANGEFLGTLEEITIVNPSPCRPMNVVYTVSGPTFRVTGNPAGSVDAAGWVNVYKNGTLVTIYASRIDAYAAIPPEINTSNGYLTVDFAAATQTYADTIPPGGSATYGFQMKTLAFGSVPPTTMGIGAVTMSVIGSTTT